MRLLTITRDHCLRQRAEFFIRQTYLDHYGAQIRSLPDRLVALVDQKDKIHCISGLRDSGEKFFSQYYLDDPVQQVIADLSGKRVQPQEIVEVTGFASRSPASTAQFACDLVLYGEELGYNWALFTATRRLGVLLKRLRLPLVELVTASAGRIPARRLWGSYYDTKPQVFVIGRERLGPFIARQRAALESCGAQSHG